MCILPGKFFSPLAIPLSIHKRVHSVKTLSNWLLYKMYSEIIFFFFTSIHCWLLESIIVINTLSSYCLVLNVPYSFGLLCMINHRYRQNHKWVWVERKIKTLKMFLFTFDENVIKINRQSTISNVFLFLKKIQGNICIQFYVKFTEKNSPIKSTSLNTMFMKV